LKSSGNTILRTAIIIKLISGFFKSREFKRDIFGKSTKYELTDFSIVNVRQVQFPGIVIIQIGVFSSEFKITLSLTACAWTRNQILLFKTIGFRDKSFSQNDQKLISAPLVWDKITDFAFTLHLNLIDLNLQHLKIISFPGVQNEDI
jgi:hypothetical protein